MTEIKNAPVALFVYNRPVHTKTTLEALSKNAGALETDIYIFSDGARDTKAKVEVAEVRALVKSVHGFKSVTVIERETNFGLAKSIIQGVTEIVNKHGRIIVLEDDLVTSPFFLTFINDALKKYENNNRVISVHGYVYPTKTALPETFFIRGADCWGWGTWLRGWAEFESDGQKLLTQIKKQKLTRAFDFDGQASYTQMLQDQIAGKNNSWAIRWNASAFIKNKLTLYPGKSLVQNIGFDNSGTHCGENDQFKVNLFNEKICVNDIKITEDIKAFEAIASFFKRSKPTFVKRVQNRIRLLLKIRSK